MGERAPPQTYTLTREEWSAINRTLAGAALSLTLPKSQCAVDRRRVRLARVRDAMDILSASYRRAEETA